MIGSRLRPFRPRPPSAYIGCRPAFRTPPRSGSTSSSEVDPPEAHAQGALGEAGVDAHRVEHMRAPDLARGAGRTGRQRDAGEIEARSGPSRPGAPAARRRRCSAAAMPRRRRSTASAAAARTAASARPRSASMRSSAPLEVGSAGRGRGGAEAGDGGDVLGAGPAAPLLPAAADQAVADLEAVRREARSRPRPSARRACAPRGSARRRREPRCRRRPCRRPAPRRMEKPAAPRARAAPPPRRAGSRRSRCWRLNRDQRPARRAPLSSRAASQSRSTIPFRSTGMRLDRRRREAVAVSTLGCSVAPTSRSVASGPP